MALTYQWQRSSNGSSWSDISNATSATYAVAASSTSDNYTYRCVVTSTINGLSAISNAVSLTLKANNPIVTSHPSSRTITEGGNATFSCSASAPYGSLSYQWQYRNSSSDPWADSGTAGSNTSSINVYGSLSSNNRQYRCKITANAGGSVAYTNAATLRVNPKAVRPTITSHPKSVSVNNGATYSMAVRASGTAPLTYKWQYKNSGQTSWSNSSQKGSTIYLTANSSANGRKYRAVVSNSEGTAYSNSATVTVT